MSIEPSVQIVRRSNGKTHLAWFSQPMTRETLEIYVERAFTLCGKVEYEPTAENMPEPWHGEQVDCLPCMREAGLLVGPHRCAVRR